MIRLSLSKPKFFIIGLYGLFTIFLMIVIELLFRPGHHLNTQLQAITYLVNIMFVVSITAMTVLERQWFNLKFIILLVVFLFNFGQLFLWSFGIHTDTEIGKINLYANFPTPDKVQILEAVVFSIYCYLALVLGMIFVHLFQNSQMMSVLEDAETEQVESVLYKFSLLLSFIVVPLTFYKAVLILRQSALNGYSTLYYSDFSVNPLIGRAEDYFFPVLVGLLLGSKYRKIKLSYILFGLYVILYTLAGERGNWLYKLLVLIWMHHAYYKPIRWQRALRVSLLGLIFLNIISVVVSLRDIGFANLSLTDVTRSLSLEENVLVRFIQEMGGSLGVSIIVLSFGQGIFSHFGNTYISSAITSFSTKIALMLGVEHVYLGNFLSQDILKIRWGTGFNMFSEAFINGGRFGVIYIFFFGCLFGYLTNVKKSLRGTYIACITTPIFCSMIRDSSLSGFRQLIQVVLFLVILIFLFPKFLERK